MRNGHRVSRFVSLWSVLLGLVVLCAGHASVVRAADMNVKVSLGWDGRTMVAERYTPITVTIDSGTEALNAVLVVEYLQDATQRVQVLQAFSTTPGRPVPVQVVACLAGSAPGLELRIESAEGRVLARRAYRVYADANRGELPIEIVMPPALVVGTLGDFPALAQLVFSALGRVPPREAESLGRVQAIARDALPVHPAAYDSLDALVVRASDAQSIDPRARAVIRQWVLGGGRLVVLADGAPDDWKAWLSDTDGAPAITTRDMPAGGVPEALVAALRERLAPPPERAESKADAMQEARRIARRAQQAKARARAQRDAGGADLPPPPPTEPADAATALPRRPGESAGAPKPPERPMSPSEYEPAKEMPRRVFRVSASASAEGWAVKFSPDGRADEGLLAVGPLGLGVVAVAGVQPSRVSATVAAQASHAAWASVLAAVLKASGGRPEDMSGASGASQRSADAIDGVLNRISDVPPVSLWVFAGIGVSVVVLAILVGPVDFFVLGWMKRLPRSWATCLLWVSLGGAAAYALPLVLRTGSTRVQRLSVLDVVSVSGRPPLAWQSSATTLWADRPLEGWFDAADAAEQPAATASRAPGVWRGVSPLGGSSGGEDGEPMAMPHVQFGQRPAGLVATGGDEWGGLPVGAEGDTSPMARGHAQSRWTLRAFADERRLSPDLRVVANETDGSFRVIARGVAAAPANIEHAALRTAAGWTGLSVGAGTGAFTHTLTRGESSAAPPEWVGVEKTARTEDNVAAMELVFGTRKVAFSPQVAMDLPGASRREQAIEARMATGEWAMVVMEVSGAEPDVMFRTSGGERIAAERRMIVRWLLPVQRGDRVGSGTGAGS